MRWSVVRLIANREVRDQLRDRRTMFLILGLPVLMYPLFLGVALVFLSALNDKKLVVGVVGVEHLPGPPPELATAIGGPAGTAATSRAFPPLLVHGAFPAEYLADEGDPLGGVTLVVRPVPTADEGLLASREVDALLVVEPGFAGKLDRGERPVLRVLGRDGEENSKLAVQGVTAAINRWTARLRETRLVRAGLPPDFTRMIEVHDPQTGKSKSRVIADELRDMLVKVIPFLLVMWALTGAIYPAIDMTAGEKERGTMETLLISPAARSEIVSGKFLAVTALGFGTAVWNVFLMAVVVGLGQVFFPYPLVSVGGLAAGVLAAIPLAMLFAAGCLALGVSAGSTKEGNYYMVPMFFLVLPLGYWSMSPGIELDGTMSWVPVTNAMLLQQRLLAVRPDPFPWRHLPAVAVSLGGCVALALAAASWQFRRETVLFRDVQTPGRSGWSLFGRKSGPA